MRDLRRARAAVTATSQNAPGLAQRASFLPAHFAGIGSLDQADLAARVDPLVRLLVGREQAPHHLVGGPGDGRDGRDAEALVDQRPPGVVDAGDDALDLERLAGDPGAT